MNFTAFTSASPWITPLVQFFTVVMVLLVLVVLSVALRRRSQLKQLAALESWEFSPAYSEEVLLKYPHLSAAQVAAAFEELRSYFLLCWQDESKVLAMPSRVVDVCWHAFICDSRNYLTFCDAVFSTYFHHEPPGKVAMPEPVGPANSDSELVLSKEAKDTNRANHLHLLAMARTYQGAVALMAKARNGNLAAFDLPDTVIGLAIPALFTIDTALGIADGHVYPTEFLKLLAEFDLKAAESCISQDSAGGGLLDAGCGDGGASCGGCGGST